MNWRAFWLAGLAVLLTACASRPPAALAPVASIPPEARVVELLVGTTRRPDADPGLMFSGERTLSTRYASLAVSIPPTHKPGEIAWASSLPPDPNVSFATARARYIDRDRFMAELRQRIRATGKRQVLVFVHGYNTRFDEAAFRFAQIVNDSDAPVTPVLFSWSSWGTLASYPYDRTSAEMARDGLEKLLSDIARDPAVGEVAVLAHSMGGWVSMEALRQMAIRDGRPHAKIRQLMLAAPDIDVDVAQQQALGMGNQRPRITLFVSRDDRALNASRFFWGSRDRLGSIDPSKEPYQTNLRRFGVDVIDLTDIQTGDSLAHAKFANSPDVVRSIGARLATGQTLTAGNDSVADAAGAVTQGTLNVVGRVITTPLTIGQDRPPPPPTSLTAP